MIGLEWFALGCILIVVGTYFFTFGVMDLIGMAVDRLDCWLKDRAIERAEADVIEAMPINSELLEETGNVES